MYDDIYNNDLLEDIGVNYNIQYLNESLKNNTSTQKIIKYWGIDNKTPDDNNDKNVLYIYHNNYYSSVTTLKSFRETNEGGNFNIFLEEINPNKHNFVYVKKKIKYYLIKHKIKFCLIFGSVEEVPTIMYKLPSDWEYSTSLNSNSTTAAADIYYGHFDNKKMKVIIGRLTSGDTKHTQYYNITLSKKRQNVENQVNKIISYEKKCNELISNSSLNNENWTKKIIGIASNDGGGYYGIDGLKDNQYMRKELKKYENINCNYTELYDSYIGAPQSYNDKNTYDLTGSPNKNNLSLAINNGASLLLYVGHANEVVLSTTNFNVNDSYLLNNKDMYFLGCAVGCSLGSHDESNMSLAEEFQVSKEKGSIAMFASTILQSWTPPMFMQRQLNDVIINTNKTLTIGEIFKKSVENFDFKNMIDYYYYHLLGDPCTRFIMTIPDIRRKF